MIFPVPHHEEYFDKTYALKDYENNFDLVYLYNKYKNGNADLSVSTDLSFETDQYTIDIDDDGIRLTASGDCGIFRAVSSLRQLLKLKGDTLPHCHIKDRAEFKKRCYLFDISCCRMPTVETYKKLIDYLAELKYNEFQIYVEGWHCFKFPEYPSYTENIDCLTVEDIDVLDEYCAERFIDLVPNHNSFGHMGAWLDTEEFKHLRVGTDEVNTATINPLLEESFEKLDKFYSCLLPHFRSEYVNIGLDEAIGLGKYQLEAICKEKGEAEVFMDWLCKLAEHIRAKYGKKVQFWADMLYEYPEAYQRVPEGAYALNWGYDMIKSSMMERHCYDLQKAGTPFYVCPGNSNWMSITGRFDVMSFNLRTAGDMGRKYGAEGYMITDWGTFEGHNHFPVWSLVPGALAAQYSWQVGVEQQGGWLKAEFIHAANKYIDDFYFDGAEVSGWLYKLMQYYLLEPERVHSGTLCSYLMNKPLSETAVEPFFDLKVCGGIFYFENVIDYIKKCIKGVSAVEFDEKWKRQVLVNAKMVLLGAELNIIRINQDADNAKIDELCLLIDEIYDEYIILWKRDNYEAGMEFYLGLLKDRKAELVAMKK